MNTRPRLIQSIEDNQEVTFTESIIISGDVGKNTKLTVMGDLTIEGTVNPGSNVKATGNVKVKQAFGKETTITSDKQISIGLVTDDVSLRANLSQIGVKLPYTVAVKWGLLPAVQENQHHSNSFNNT